MKIGIETRIAAAEARCGPQQTINDEGTAHVLQIWWRKSRESICLLQLHSHPHVRSFQHSGNPLVVIANNYLEPFKDWASKA
jgi:hypothetical protein